MLDQITPVILCFNEEANLPRTLSALAWANEVLVVDSYSTDASLAVCEQFENVRLVQNKFVSAADQGNFALAQNIKTPWVLSMDADYVVTNDLRAELASLLPNDDVSGFVMSFRFLIDGQVLHGSLYPPRTCLYRHARAHYIQDGHTQRVVVDGLILTLQNALHHDDRKPFSRWLNSQKNYARLEAEKFKQRPWSSLSAPDKLRYFGLGPLLVVPYTLLIKGVILSGLPGLKYAWQRFLAECYLLMARLPF